MEESIKNYIESVNRYFQRVKSIVEEVIAEVVNYPYKSDFGHVQFVVYPEQFCDEFSVYCWTIDKDGEMIDGVESNIFSTRVTETMDSNLDPYDMDEDWRETVFQDQLNDFFSRVIEESKPETTVRMFLHTPDASQYWDVNRKSWVQIDLTKGFKIS